MNKSLGKTPRSKIRLARRDENPDDITDQDDYKLFLMKKQWKVFKVTPLVGFSYRNARLNSLAREFMLILKCEVTGQLKWEIVRQNKELLVEFRELKGLKVSDWDSEAVTISVNIVTVVTGHIKNIFSALLCSVGAGEDHTSSRGGRTFTLLPLMLCNGEVNIMNQAQHFLQKKFRCCISKMFITPIELKWMLCMWPIALDSEGDVNIAGLVYQASEHEKIEVSIKQRDFYDIWKSLHNEESDDLEIEEVNNILSSLHSHFQGLTGINFNQLELLEVATAVLIINTFSKLKFCSRSHIKRILEHLTGLCTILRFRV